MIVSDAAMNSLAAEGMSIVRLRVRTFAGKEVVNPKST